MYFIRLIFEPRLIEILQFWEIKIVVISRYECIYVQEYVQAINMGIGYIW
jgi:hypothetical protein